MTQKTIPKWFRSESSYTLDKANLKDLFAISSKFGMEHKLDYKELLARYDYDRDGSIGLEDFKRMSLI